MVTWRKRAASWHESCSKRLKSLRSGPSSLSATPLFTDSTEENFPCRYGDEVVSESSCFILLEGLGSGAFGQVVRCAAAPKTAGDDAGCDGWRRVRHASHVRHARPVALKILKHKDFCAEVALEAEEEAKILRELHHPHIVQMLDFFEFRGHLCIALELLGRNLYELITEHNGLLSIQLVQQATYQVLLALEYLKTHQVIHADLKPENVLMVDSAWRSDGKAHFKVIDFGGARREGFPMEDLVLQTLPYRAPEVLLGLPVKCAADMWSLGCICIELFVGESLFSHSKDKDEILEGMVQLCGKIPAWMLKQGTRTNEFFDRVKQRTAARTKPRPQGLWRLFAWACSLRDTFEAFRPRTSRTDAADGAEVYKFRRRSVGPASTAMTKTTLFGAFRRRRYDLVKGRFGAPQRLSSKPLGQQQRLRRNMEKLIRRMLVLDPERRSDASELLRMKSQLS
mmetsp:Transcript_1783/g.4164  ORF Transcript_1783/g.4164 Transcript_1783/m.4164 type:complete len:454 (+) Transcript_1783:19-1380(+)